MLEFRIPITPEEFLEDVDESLRENLFRFSVSHIERIETKRELLIGRIEDNDIVFPRLRNIGECLLEEISMRIDDPESLPAPDIVDEQIGDEFGFPDPGLPDDVGMSESVLIVYPDRDADRSVITDPDYIHIWFYILCRNFSVAF